MKPERIAELWKLVHEGCLNCHLIKDCLEEIGQLQAVVAKLPKTEDGVPVVPGDTYWCVFEDDSGDYDAVNGWVVLSCRYVGHAKPHVDYDWEIPGVLWDGAEVPPGFAVYSTEAAAREAGE